MAFSFAPHSLRARSGATTARLRILEGLGRVGAAPRNTRFLASSSDGQNGRGDDGAAATASTPAPSTTPTPPPPPPERKSFAVATGEFFLGLASFLIRNRSGAGDGERAGSGASSSATSSPAVQVLDGREGRPAASVEQAVLWEQRPEDVDAERERGAVTSPGFSFSAAGLLFPYHLGAASFLMENGYINERTPLAGSSAGAIVCAVIASGESMHNALKITKMLAEDCRLNGTAFRLGALLRDILHGFLPDDVHVKASGRIRVAITQLLWRPKGLLVDKFDSKDDLINAIITSSFIPGYLAPRPATLYRKRLCIDGGLTLFMPPSSASETVRICAFPASQLGLRNIGISPDCNPEHRATTRQLFSWALEPAEDDILDRLYELGYLDASTWAGKNPVDMFTETHK